MFCARRHEAPWRAPHSASRRYKGRKFDEPGASAPGAVVPTRRLRPSGTSVGGGGQPPGAAAPALFLRPSGPEAQLPPADAAVPSRRPADHRHPGRLPVQRRLDRKVEKSRPEVCHRSSRAEVGRSMAPLTLASPASSGPKGRRNTRASAPGWRHPTPEVPEGRRELPLRFERIPGAAFPGGLSRCPLSRCPGARLSRCHPLGESARGRPRAAAEGPLGASQTHVLLGTKSFGGIFRLLLWA